MSRARELSRLGNPNIISADGSFNVGFGTLTPKEKVNVVGVVSATSFFGDGSGLDGIASAGIGTALSDDKTKALNTIYYTNNEVLVNTTSTIDPPESGYIAYTQAPTIVVEDTKELIVAPGDDLLVDVLGISTGVNVDYAQRGNGVFGNIYVDNIESSGGQTSVNFPKGLVSSGVATFTSDVSIGGTLTYEDVKNVDSVGLITARTGIKVIEGGIDAVGVVTATSFDGSGANLTGIEGPSVQMIVNGALSAGEGTIVTSAGKAAKITGLTGQLGSRVSVNNQKEDYVSCCQVSATQYVIAYADGADNNLKARVATITDVGNSVITYGAAVTFLAATSACKNSVCYDSNVNRVFIAFCDKSNSNHGSYIVGTISGTGASATITFGTKATYLASSSNAPMCCFDATNNKVFITADDSSAIKGWVATIASSGNSATTAGESIINSNSINARPYYHPGSGKIIIQYKDQGASGALRYLIATVSGTSISYGSAAQASNAGNTPNYDMCVLNSTQFLSIFRDETDSGKGKSTIGTISGTTITFGSMNTWESTFVSGLICTVDYKNPTNVRIYFSLNSPSNAARVINGTTSGTGSGASTSWGAASTISGWGHIQASNQGYEIDKVTTYSGNARTFIIYRDGEGSGNTYCVVDSYSGTDLTAENFIGFSKAAYTDGQTGTIKVVGNTLTGQSGLTPGQKYYVQGSGSLGTTADDPSVVAGRALTATSLLIQPS